MPRIIDAFTQFFDDNGDPLVDGLLKFVESGTNNTDKDTFADINEIIKNTNPVELDAAGRCPNVFGTGTYNVISYTSSMVQIQQFDPVGGDQVEGAFASWNSVTIYGAGELVTGPDGEYYRSLTPANQNQNPTTSIANWELVTFNQIWNTNVTYELGDPVYGPDGFLYISTAAANLGNNPTTDNTKWRHGTRNGQWVVGGGTADAITATFSPAKGAWDEDIFYVVATGANTVTNPTIDVGPSAKTIVMNGDSALAVGSIPSAGFIMALKYGVSNDNVELLNPKELVTDSVTSTRIAAGAVTSEKIAAGAVGPVALLAPTDGSTYTLVNLATEATAGNDVYALASASHVFRCQRGGTYNVAFDLKVSSISYIAYGRIYKNGIAFGTEQSTSSTSYVEKAEALTFAAGDTIELWTKDNNPLGQWVIRDFAVRSGIEPYAALITADPV